MGSRNHNVSWLQAVYKKKEGAKGIKKSWHYYKDRCSIEVYVYVYMFRNKSYRVIPEHGGKFAQGGGK